MVVMYCYLVRDNDRNLKFHMKIFIALNEIGANPS